MNSKNQQSMEQDNGLVNEDEIIKTINKIKQMQSMQNSPYKKIGTNTFSIPSQSPDKLNTFSSKPFELISRQPYYQTLSRPSLTYISNGFDKNDIKKQNSEQEISGQQVRNSLKELEHGEYGDGNKQMFRTYDLYRNPMLESIDGDFPQLIESQMINNKMINNQNPPFLYNYENHQYHNKYPVDSANQYVNRQGLKDMKNQYAQDNQSGINSKIKLNLSPGKSYGSQYEKEVNSRNKIESPEKQKISEPYIKTQSNLLEDNDYDNWVFNQQQQNYQNPLYNNQNQRYSNQLNQQKSNLSQRLQIQSKKTIEAPLAQPLTTNDLAQTQYVQNSYNPPQRANQKSLIVNEDISEVKYRLDQLMNRFPIESFQTNKKDPQVKNKKEMLDLSAPQLQMRRTNSIDQNESFRFQSRFNEQEPKRNPHTQGKIFIHQHNQRRRQNFGSEQLLAKNNSESKGGYSLNYSESGINSTAQIHIPKPQINHLYQHIREQQQIIHNYKLIIAKLQTQNAHLLNIIQNQSKTIQSNSIQKNYLGTQFVNNPNQNHLENPPNTHFIKNPDSQHKNSHLSDSFHKLERQHSHNPKLHNSQSQNFQLNSHLNKPSKLKSSGKINPTLQQQVDILQAQKAQLLKKIDWLNGVVQEMMNMTTKPKSQNSIILDNIQPSYRNSKKSRQYSGDIGKVSKVIQTSFLQSDSTPILNTQNLNYKQLYQKQIKHKKLMKDQINDLLELQNSYSTQFQMILKEINEIKRNRAYYQELKKEIQKSKDKSIKKQQNDLRSRSPLAKHSIKQSTKQIFENQVIYQLKSENEHLLSKYLKLKQQYAKQMAVKNNLNLSTSNVEVSNDIIQPQESVIAPIDKNGFEGRVSKKKERVEGINEMGQNKNRQRQRGGSYDNTGIAVNPLIRKKFTQSRMKSDESRIKYNESRMKTHDNRKNGTIYSSYQVQETRRSRKKLTEFNRNENGLIKQRWGQDLQDIDGQRGNQFYRNGFNVKNESISRVTERSYGPRKSGLSYRIEEQQSKCTTNESSQKMIGRYNNFIKNMKQRFGINSSIIGKEIPTD